MQANKHFDFRLWHWFGWRTLPAMRVEVVTALPKQEATGAPFSDAAVERGLKNFLAALGTDDSLFIAEASEILVGNGSPSGCGCGGTITLGFREEKLAGNRGVHFKLVEKLSELLRQAGSADSLSARLCVRQPGSGPRERAFALQVWLAANGSSSEQAALRWVLGLAHLQQALLFASRLLRQQLMQRGN